MKNASAWMPFVCVPGGILFAIGAIFGWWFIEHDAGRVLRDTGRAIGQQDLLEAAIIYGLIAGLLGVVLGLVMYGVTVLVKRSKRN